MRDSIWSEEALSFAETTLYDAARLAIRTATYKGSRSSVTWMNDLLFRAISDELEAEGIPRKVAADMLGMSTRHYQRLLKKRDAQSDAEESASLWEQVFNLFTESPRFPAEICQLLAYADVEVLMSIIADMKKNKILDEYEGMFFIEDDTQQMDDPTLEEFIISLQMRNIPIDNTYASRISGRSESDIDLFLDRMSKQEPRFINAEDSPSIFVTMNSLMMNTSKFCHAYLSGAKPEGWRATMTMQPVDMEETDFFESLSKKLDTLHVHASDILNSIEEKDRNHESPRFHWGLVQTFGGLLPLRDRSENSKG